MLEVQATQEYALCSPRTVQSRAISREHGHISHTFQHRKVPPRSGQDLWLQVSDTQRLLYTAWPTSQTEIRQRLLITLEVIIYPEALVVLVKRTQFPQERQILSWILSMRYVSRGT